MFAVAITHYEDVLNLMRSVHGPEHCRFPCFDRFLFLKIAVSGPLYKRFKGHRCFVCLATPYSKNDG